MKLTFDEPGTFNALYAAERWCDHNGYSRGSTDRSGVIGLMKGNYDIAKWHNLTKQERRACDGVMTGDFREGPVTVHLYEEGEKRLT